MKRKICLKLLNIILCLMLAAPACFCVPVFAAGMSSDTAAGERNEETDEEEAEELRAAERQIRDIHSISRYGMTPLSGEYVAEGTYPIDTKSNSVYFRMQDGELTVADGVMTARFTIPSMSYQYVFMGTKKEAAEADPSDYIGFEEVDGCTVFTVPVEALNKELDCAAFSRNRKKWYDRKIIFYADSLPKEVLSVDLPDYDLIEKSIVYYADSGEAGTFEYEQEDDQKYPEEDPDALFEYDAEGNPLPVAVDLQDGEYSIEVNMTGGSGRASVSSPTWMIVKDGAAYARLLWSSTYYDYMIVGGKTYYNLTTDGGNSVFEIPIPVMNESFPVIADTTAMGEPVEIQYKLTFYDDTVGDSGQIPQVAAGNVLIVAVIILGAGAVINYIIKKKRAQ